MVSRDTIEDLTKPPVLMHNLVILETIYRRHAKAKYVSRSYTIFDR